MVVGEWHQPGGLGKNGPGKNGPGKNGPEKTARGIIWLVVESVKTVRSFRWKRSHRNFSIQHYVHTYLLTYLHTYLRETKKRILAVAERQRGAENASESLIFSQITQFIVTTKNTMTFWHWQQKTATQAGMDLLRRIMPPLAQPLIDYFNLAFQSVSGVQA